MNKLSVWPQKKAPKGFSLIELMVVVAIVAILSAIAIPQYTDYVTRAKIPDATSTLASKRVQMEQYFQDNHTYLCATCAGNVPPPCVQDATSSKYFTFDCGGAGSAATGTSYGIEAVGVGPMNGFVYTINQDNTKTTAAVPTGWAQPNPNNCWVTKKGGVC
jgi:type IV pilus assembly protein PilE